MRLATTLPTQHELVPNLSVLDRLLKETTAHDHLSAVMRQTEQLPYYLRGACSAFSQLEAARIEAVNSLDRLGVNPGGHVILSPDDLDPLSFAIDAYLFNMRRTFDALGAYLGRCPESLSLPSSFTDIAKGIEKGKYPKLDKAVQSLILEFWSDIGSSITGYRDQINHKAIILSNCIAFRSDDGVNGLKMLLPGDPIEKTPSKIGYIPEVHAMNFAYTSLGKTVRFVNNLVEQMIDLMAPNEPNVRSRHVVGVAMRGGPQAHGQKIEGEPVPFPRNVAEFAGKLS